jgi:hypothetical protein
MSKTQFQQAKQGEREAIIAYHTRLRELFSRAYPTANPQRAAELIDKFILGLAHPVVRDRTFDAHPGTYSDALDTATSKAAGVLVMKQTDGFRGHSNPSILAITPEGALVTEENQVGAVGVRNDGCFKCGEIGHFKRECPLWATAGRGRYEGRGDRRRGGNRGGRGWRGRSSGWRDRRPAEEQKKSPPRGFTNRQISALADLVDQIDLERKDGGAGQQNDRQEQERPAGNY